MSTIVTRAGKGSALTIAELDANFTNINVDAAAASAASEIATAATAAHALNLVSMSTQLVTTQGVMVSVVNEQIDSSLDQATSFVSMANSIAALQVGMVEVINLVNA